MRTLIKFLLCIAILLLFCSCSADSSQADVSGYLERFAAMDYSAMYAYTAPAVDIDEETFEQKYDAIFSGLGVTEIAIDNLSGPDADGVYTYTATYKTTDYGDFTNDFTLKTGVQDGKSRILWNYDLIFPEMEEGSTVHVETLNADRGEIFAADGTLLAQNAYADTVYMDTSKVQDIAQVAQVAGPITGLADTEITDMYNDAVANATQIVKLQAFPADKLTEEQKQSLLSVEGLGIDDKMYTPIRYYPLKEAAAHVLGYTGYASEDALPEGYTAADRLGLAGLEARYETELRGVNGEIVYIQNKWGDNVRTLYEVPVQEGQDLRLTIDPQLQQKAYDALINNLNMDGAVGQTGVAIVMDAKTGYVQAMVSYPSYDDNLFSFPLSDADWNYLNSEDSGNPLYSRATQGQYPPGSVIKPFVASVALDEGVITPDTAFEGDIVENQWTPTEDGWVWGKITRVEESGWPLQLRNAMLESDNIYFAWVALKLGEQSMLDYLTSIGMEQAVPFDLPVKEANALKSTTSMNRGLLAAMGYGQGELLVTPIQMAAMYTAFANGTGDMMQPILVQSFCRTDGLKYDTLSEQEPAVWIQNAVSGSSLATLSPILEDVIAAGTGRPTSISGVRIAGKTGTAEIGNDKSREISWFAGYWLDGYYDRLVVVMVDVAAEEGPVKFKIAKELLSP